jgi:hypothetical protein
MRIEYYAAGRKRRITVHGLFEAPRPTERRWAVVRTLPAGPLTAGSCFSALEEETVRVVRVEASAPTVIPTETMSIGGARATEVAWLRRQFGMEVVEEGSHAKVLLAALHDAADPVRLVARAATAVFERGRVESAQPNVLRLRSGRGEDALELANYVYERVRPDAAQARFLRVVTGKDPPAPGTG